MNFTLAAVMAAMLAVGQAASAGGAAANAGRIERFSPALDELIAPGTVVEPLTDDRFQWSEGPVWVPDGQYVVFSDVPRNTAWKWSEAGGLEEFLNPSALDAGQGSGGPGTNGLMLSLDGKLLMCDHGSRSVVGMDLATGERDVLAGRFGGKRFNSPNDLVVSRVRWPGAVFFTDPPYGLEGQDESPLKELQHNGIYRLDPDGTVTLLDASMERPNGIALSPDEKTLYVANSQKHRAVWMAYDLDVDGNPAGEGRLFASAKEWADEGLKGLPDGMAVDGAGNLWATGPGGVYVIDPEGNMLGRIETGSAVANCAFGGEDGKTLFMTSDGFLARIATRVKGLGL